MFLSIIIPLYHGEKYYDRLLNMVETNVKHLKEWNAEISVEVIMVNDSPQDPIEKKQLEEKNKISLDHDCSYQLSIYQNKENSGIHRTRVTGLEHATGDYILFLDQDDQIAEDYLVRQLKAIGDYNIVICNGYRKFPDYSKNVFYQTGLALKLACRKSVYLYGTDMIFSPGQCLIRRSSIPEEWMAEENCLRTNGCDDFLLWLLMMEHNTFYATEQNAQLYIHNEHENNVSGESMQMYRSFEQMCEILSKNKLIKSRWIKILRRRYDFRVAWKSSGYIAKAVMAIKNIDVLFFTVLYKISGFY